MLYKAKEQFKTTLNLELNESTNNTEFSDVIFGHHSEFPRFRDSKFLLGIILVRRGGNLDRHLVV